MDIATRQLRTLYPEIEPYKSGMLDVGDGHQLYWELCGNPSGKPVIFLHGGPGGGASPSHRCQFDPARYNILVFDQRGCGRSTPHASLEANTTWHLVEDIERLRIMVGVDKWMVFGGSWGSTLALAYATKHGAYVSELILRGIFTLRRSELLWFYQKGADALFPDLWEGFVAPIPPDERHDLIAAYHRRLTGTDSAIQIECARAWSRWEAATISLLPNPARVEEFGADRFATAFARIECHYFVNRGFFATDDYLLANAPRLNAIPGVIIQGRYDVVTPAETAWALHRAWPEASFEMIADAGHTATEPGIADALVRATDRFRPE